MVKASIVPTVKSSIKIEPLVGKIPTISALAIGTSEINPPKLTIDSGNSIEPSRLLLASKISNRSLSTRLVLNKPTPNTGSEKFITMGFPPNISWFKTTFGSERNVPVKLPKLISELSKSRPGIC